jgi:PKD repeat protein
MKMKKFLALACAAATIGFATVSCSDDETFVPEEYSVSIKSKTGTFEVAQQDTLVLAGVVEKNLTSAVYSWSVDGAVQTATDTVLKFVSSTAGDHTVTFTVSNQAGAGTATATVKVIPVDIVTFENAELDEDGILRTETLIEEDDLGGSFYEAYSEAGIIFKSYDFPAWMAWGGFEISNNHDMTTVGLTNEASVYHPSGHSGSKFAICYDFSMMGPGYESEFYVADSSNKVFDHVYITNSTWAALEMLNGGFGKQFSYADRDWFKLTVKGFDSNGTEKGTVEFYLADFRTANAVGIVTEWTKVNLQPLGAVQKLQFSLSSSDTGDWGINTPAYFCMDDLVIRK